MSSAEIPCWGAYNYKWNNCVVHVPAGLNNVARYKPNSFWVWLTDVKYKGFAYINMAYEHLEEEQYQREKIRCWQFNDQH